MRKLLAAGIACVLTLSGASIVVAQQTDPAEATSPRKPSASVSVTVATGAIRARPPRSGTWS
ncbi:MAG: hypothetical protein AAGC76_20325 [Luteibacter sp.]|uniref:hypothetical protein n=1 Tax=Luteibacter sp. TaxID=1886636 RepID=UPI002807E382|nr:hypothetical protein [Luteibacter sp.]MDQ7998197.1 hypothetical protein [Luteibacter sp.]